MDRRGRVALGGVLSGGRALWAVYAVLGVLLGGYLVSLLVRGHEAYSPLLDGFAVVAVEFVACVLCIARGFVKRPGGGVALALGAGFLCWCVGDFVLTLESLGGATPGTPSLADVFYLSFYPIAYVGVVMFIRGEVRRLATPSWLDGLIAGLGVASVCAAFAFRGILRSTGGSVAATVTNLAYPLGDLLLLGLVAGATVVLGGRRKAPWALLAGGIALVAAGDTVNLFGNSLGDSHAGTVLDGIAWPTATVLVSMSVWLRPRPSDPLVRQRQTGFLLPELAAAAALAILLVGALDQTSRVALGLATATLLAVGVRLGLSARGLRALGHMHHQQSVTDDLTGLKNRRHLFHVLDAFFADHADASDRTESLAFLFVDLNRFKEINDSFGHPAGDELLKQLGPRLTDVLRSSDLAVRLGGDELAVVLLDGDPGYATAVAQRLTASIERPFRLGAVSANISASIGIAFAPTDAADSGELVWSADVAMYRAKLGNLPFAFFEQELDQGSRRFNLAEELGEAIDEHELVLHYQPQLDLRSGEIVAVEALLRWAHPRLGLLPPLKFLPLAEEAGLMRSITEFVLEEALAQCAAWRVGGTDLAVSVNVSATNLLDQGFSDLIQRLLVRHRLPADALVLEITETSIISEFEQSRLVIESLTDLGLTVSIDDFGAGFTSLAYLNQLAIGELKLDRAFVAQLGQKHDSELVRATIDLGHALGLRVVAEGIEDRVTLDRLLSLGCDRAQGYFIGKPKPATELSFKSHARRGGALLAPAGDPGLDAHRPLTVVGLPSRQERPAGTAPVRRPTDRRSARG